MPWIPIIPLKSNTPVDPIAPASKVESRVSNETLKQTQEKDRVPLRANSKKFAVAVRSNERSSEVDTEHQVDRDEPASMTSSTFKSMGGVKVIALPAPNCESQSEKALASTQRKRGIHLPPLCFDLDHEFDLEMDKHDGPASIRNSYKVSCHSCRVTEGATIADVYDASNSQLGPTRNDSGRKLLGHLALDVVGVYFHKTVASQPRSEGDSVFLVREPGNKFDGFALRVLLQQDSGQIGHIPRDVAKYLSPLIDENLIATEARLTTSFQGAKLKIPRTIPIIIKFFQISDIVSEHVKGALKQLMLAITPQPDGGEAKRGRIGVPDDLNAMHDMTSSSTSNAPITPQGTGPSPGLGKQNMQIQKFATDKIYASNKFMPEELSLPVISVGRAPAIDVVGLLTRAGLKTRSCCTPASEKSSDDLGVLDLVTPNYNSISADLDERIEDSQIFKPRTQAQQIKNIERNLALFDMAILDFRAADVGKCRKRFKKVLGQVFALRKRTAVEQLIKQQNDAERAARSAGMCILNLDHLKLIGMEMSSEEALDQGFYLPVVDMGVLANLK